MREQNNVKRNWDINSIHTETPETRGWSAYSNQRHGQHLRVAAANWGGEKQAPPWQGEQRADNRWDRRV